MVTRSLNYGESIARYVIETASDAEQYAAGAVLLGISEVGRGQNSFDRLSSHGLPDTRIYLPISGLIPSTSRDRNSSLNAVGVAIDPKAKGRGVLVVMNDQIHAAHSLTKTSTTDVQTFMSPQRGVVGVAAYGKNDFYNAPPWKHTTSSEFDVSNVTKLPRVDIIFPCADMGFMSALNCINLQKARSVRRAI